MEADEAELVFEGGAAGANIYHATRFLAPDPFAFLRHRSRRIAVLSDLEIGRARKEGELDELVSLKATDDALREAGVEEPKIADILERVMRERGIARVVVPESFPAGLAEKLRGKGFGLAVREDPFYPDRETKSEPEIGALEANQRRTEEALAHAVGLIERARPRADGVLVLDGEPLSAERVRFEITVFLLRHGLEASHTIVAGGDQGCDPHCRGSGPLRAGETIILDLFPRSADNLYWADLTRTVYKGKAPEDVKRLYRAVEAAQEVAFSRLRDGADGLDIHRAVQASFEQAGWKTEKRDGTPVGFIHGTGHGVGLEIHERPRISIVKAPLRAGMVVTVEPGLYYPGLGGVRLEDLVVITQDGYRNLTRAPKVLEVP